MSEPPEIPSGQVSLGVVDLEVGKRSLTEEPKKVVSTFLDFLRHSVIPLLKYLDKKRD